MLPDQSRVVRQLVDAETDAILFRHPSLQGLPDLVVEGDGTNHGVHRPNFSVADYISL